MLEFPISKLCLNKNSKALKNIKEGLQQSKEGKIQKRGSFAKYAENEINHSKPNKKNPFKSNSACLIEILSVIFFKHNTIH